MNNLTVKTKEAQFTVACEDAECNSLFRKIVKRLSTKLLGTEAEKSATNHCKCGTIAEKVEESKEQPEPQEITAAPACITQDLPDAETRSQPQRKYRGTLFVKCPHCGREFFYYQNEPSSECARCNCGNSFLLENMKYIRAYCKCGNQIVAMTNESNDIITIACHTCGAPLDLEYNKKENRYESMR